MSALILTFLRVSVAATFFGHGGIALFGGSAKWRNYLSVAGIKGQSTQSVLFFLIGALDVGIACLCLLSGTPVEVFSWACAWGVATAAMRPLAGEGVLEFVERGGNFIPASAIIVILSGSYGSVPSLLSIGNYEQAFAFVAKQLLPVSAQSALGEGAMAQFVLVGVFLACLAVIGATLRLTSGAIKQDQAPPATAAAGQVAVSTGRDHVPDCYAIKISTNTGTRTGQN